MKKIILVLAILAAVAAQPRLYAQIQLSGESHPELLASAEQPDGPADSAPPIAAIQPAAPAPAPAPALHMPDNNTIASPTSPTSSTDDTDNGIVTRVPYHEGELPEGTIIRTHLNQAISTSYTQQGTEFSARLVHDVLQEGRVIIPVGSTVRGRVTQVVEKRRVQGRAKLRLRADEVILPDGSRLILHAQVIDTDTFTNTKTDNEGTIVSTDNARKNWEIAGSTTGAGAATGAIIGGGVGAVVGTFVGAGIGAGHYMMAHPVAALPESSTVVFQLTEPMEMTPLHE